MMCLGYRPPIIKAGRMPQKSLNSSILVISMVSAVLDGNLSLLT
uniref:Uncharacterized protein n=1 Tax=Anguilla anguilla TaxID=7936 RepID=A0A0E9PA77_ANGAN